MTSATVFATPEPRNVGLTFSTLRYISQYAQARGIRPAWRLATKAVCRPIRASAWFAELENYRAEFDLCEAGLHFYALGPLRLFLRAGLTFEQRLQLSRTHHAAIGAVLSVNVIRNIWARRQTKLGVIAGRSGSSFALWLGAADYPREGNIQIMLTREAPDGSPSFPLARVTFSLAETVETSHRRALHIGGLQGSPRAIGKRAIIEATRDLRGLRPKAAVILAAQAFAAHADCKAILAVSDANHIINVQSEKTRGRKTANYDSFWLERGGAPRGFLGFELPLNRAEGRPQRNAVFDCVKSAFIMKPGAS